MIVAVFNEVPRKLVGYLRLPYCDQLTQTLCSLMRVAPDSNLTLEPIEPNEMKRLHTLKFNSDEELGDYFKVKRGYSLYRLRVLAWVNMEPMNRYRRGHILRTALPMVRHEFYQ